MKSLLQRFGLYIFMFVLNCVSVLGFSFTSHAEETLEPTTYYVEIYEKKYNSSNNWVDVHERYELVSSVPIAFSCLRKSYNGANYYYVYPKKGSSYGDFLYLELVSSEVLDKKGDFSYTPKPSEFGFYDNYTYHSFGPDVGADEYRMETNIPKFNSINDMVDYFNTGNKDNIILDSINDESFFLTGFKADNKINASWSGTTLAPDVEYNDLKLLLAEDYCLKDYPTQVTVNHVRGGKFDLDNNSMFVDIGSLQEEDENLYLFCVHFRPYYTTDTSVVYGKDTLLYFNPDGSIKEISGDKETVDSSIGFLQGVKYVEDVTSHDFTLSWEKSKDYDENYRVEIMTDVAFKENLTSDIVVKNKVYQSYKFAPYYFDFEYSDNTRNVVLSSLGSTDYFFYDVYRYYLRIAYFDPLTKTYSYGGWVKLTVDHDSPSSASPVLGDVVTGNFDDDGNWIDEKESDDSYHDKFNGESGASIIDNPNYIIGTDIDGNLDLGTLGKSFLSSFNSLFSYIGTFPSLLGSLFNFIPSSIIALLSMAIIVCIILRILGR